MDPKLTALLQVGFPEIPIEDLRKLLAMVDAYLNATSEPVTSPTKLKVVTKPAPKTRELSPGHVTAAIPKLLELLKLGPVEVTAAMEQLEVTRDNLKYIRAKLKDKFGAEVVTDNGVMSLVPTLVTESKVT